MQERTYTVLKEMFENRILIDPELNDEQAFPRFYTSQAAQYNKVKDILRTKSNEGEEVVDVENFIQDYLNQFAQNVEPSFRSDGGRAVFTFQLPILTDEILIKLEANIMERNFSPDSTIAAFAAAIICETKAFNMNASLDSTTPMAIWPEIASYCAWKAIETNQQTEFSAFPAVNQKMKEALAKAERELAAEIDKMKAEYSAAAFSLNADISSLSERLIQAETSANLAHQQAATFEAKTMEITDEANKLSDEIVTKYHVAKDAAKAGLDALRTEANFDTLKIHWINRGKSARVAWMVSAIVLLVLLVVLPVVAILEKDVVVTFINDLLPTKISAGDGPVAVTVATVSRLVIITIPLGLYFWLIRLVVRYNMRSMLLMDDADQRATMLETYYRMIEKQAATVTDRALVLQALMRPAPGHGSDTIDPPNFADVIEKAMGKGAGGA